ncbi:nitroreductase family protein [Pseudoalteromonas denitrificans]|uniref:Nitroreductase n=1 Tax=Pseudoalteromonas denitrificans DSM 6059 TaxID=1123010 RepID=A0A1I1FA70_9GAMM|nr:nitroreductase family protein [Pseudoalteromonas denitrificans]SFB95852.1 Nitroreductase [Pseudoalteromonas denitrificans DSM 6059]
MSLKSNLKLALQKSPLIWGVYYRTKTEILRVVKLRYYLYDISQNYKAMHWSVAKTKRSIISAELLFQYHKLEKGLVMPGPKRLFGLAPARATMALISKWQRTEIVDEKDAIYRGAVGTLQSYYDRIVDFKLDENNVITDELSDFLATHSCERTAYNTPCQIMQLDATEANYSEQFSLLMNARRSVRTFSDEPVASDVIKNVVRISQLSPSACNRQPVKVTIVNDPEMKKKLLSHQNGNTGFGHLAPHIAVITTDASCFFGVTERHEPYVDGGLFSMSFILALKSHNISSCCLNWCVKPKTDKAAHKLLGLDPSLRIIMLIAIGYAPEKTPVPRSPRRDLDDVLNII